MTVVYAPPEYVRSNAAVDTPRAKSTVAVARDQLLRFEMPRITHDQAARPSIPTTVR
ncbi:hypothetical protein [Streptomyces sp. NPDC001020]